MRINVILTIGCIPFILAGNIITIEMFRFLILVSLLLLQVPRLYGRGRGYYVSANEQVEDCKTVIAIRSNLLLPALNVGAELPVGNRSSFAVDHYYPWAWPDKSNKDCFELL